MRRNFFIKFLGASTLWVPASESIKRFWSFYPRLQTVEWQSKLGFRGVVTFDTITKTFGKPQIAEGIREMNYLFNGKTVHVIRYDTFLTNLISFPNTFVEKLNHLDFASQLK